MAFVRTEVRNCVSFIRIHRHPRFYRPRAFSNDIAIVEVYDGIDLSATANIKPICLPSRPYRAGTRVP